MFRRTLPRVVAFILAFAAAAARGSEAPAPEFAESTGWFDRFLPTAAGAAPRLPCSFNYDGKPALESLAKWPAQCTERTLDAQRTERTVIHRDPATGLEVRCVAVTYRDYPVVEWTVYCRNTGTADTPVVSDLRALDTAWTREGQREFQLHYSFGTFFPLSARDFLPQEETLEPGRAYRLLPDRGRPSAGVMPYFNLERGDASGVIIAVGWPGAWAADFNRDDTTGVRVAAGQELVRTRLLPGEEIRTPLMALLFWRGDWIGAQNTWRRWMLAHNLPRPFGAPHRPHLMPSSSAQFGEMVRANEASQIEFIDRYLEEKFPIDTWWMDAGWYENAGRWQEPIALRVDRQRFPRGLRPVTDHAHARGLKTLLWFEPERIMSTNELWRDHPDWLLPNRITKRLSRLFYLGNPAAAAWLTERVSRILDEEGIDIYRNDFNVVEPVELWRSNDLLDRQGITENHHVTGYLAYFDELRRRRPGLVIDSCAGGGSRNDLETMRRALPFYRSDYLFDVVSNQCQSYGLALWLPFQGTTPGPTALGVYELRSHMACPVVLPAWDLRDRKLPYDLLRREVAAWQNYAPNYFGDFYPLTPCTLSEEVWLAWQFHRPEAGLGVVQAFRRAKCIYQSARVKLRGLEAAASYRLTDVDDDTHPRQFTGRELMETGFDLAIAAQPGAVIVNYEKVRVTDAATNSRR